MPNKRDIGFVIIKLENNPFHDNVIKCIESFISNNRDNQYIIFNSSCEKINTGSAPILHLSQSKFFYGDLFVFDFVSLILTQQFPNIRHRYFYAQDLFWESSPQIPYNNIKNIVTHNNIDIIAKNQYIYDIYNICWKLPVGISENFDYESIKKII